MASWQSLCVFELIDYFLEETLNFSWPASVVTSRWLTIVTTSCTFSFYSLVPRFKVVGWSVVLAFIFLTDPFLFRHNACLLSHYLLFTLFACQQVAGHFTYGVMTLSAATFLFWNAFGSKILPLAFQQGSPVSLALQLSCSVLVWF